MNQESQNILNKIDLLIDQVVLLQKMITKSELTSIKSVIEDKNESKDRSRISSS